MDPHEPVCPSRDPYGGPADYEKEFVTAIQIVTNAIKTCPHLEKSGPGRKRRRSPSPDGGAAVGAGGGRAHARPPAPDPESKAGASGTGA